jgi:tetratricopeptide (TPR) repeat protein
MRLQLRSFSCLILLLLFTMIMASGRVCAQRELANPAVVRVLQHQDPQWLLIQPHLPDPATATAAQLEMVGDVLRARRFPEDALDYYNYALRRGGNPVPLFNKLGVTNLELRHIDAARMYFQRVVQLSRKDGQGWNNLGVVEYLNKQYGHAISDYKRAIKADKRSAVFHSNLGTAYFEQKDFPNARRQFEVALRIDPEMASHDSAAGVTAHMLSPEDRALYCFEMARLYAEHGDEISMMHYLTMASEAGLDLIGEMSSDKVLAPYRKDPRVVLLVKNAQALRSNPNAIADMKGGLPPLPPATQQ